MTTAGSVRRSALASLWLAIAVGALVVSATFVLQRIPKESANRNSMF
jgi:hypothetical protein